MILDPDFPDHWKTRLLVEMLEDESAAMCIIRLWCHCQNRRTTQFEANTIVVKAICRWKGDAGLLDSALLAAGFIARDGNTLEVLGWEDHNASLVSNWKNGLKGGRPCKQKPEAEETQSKPNRNPIETQKEPSDNPSGTQSLNQETHKEPCREDRCREVLNSEEKNTPLPLLLTENEKPKGKRLPKEGPMPEIPEALKTHEFETAWDSWVRYRGKKLTPEGARLVFQDFLKYGPEIAADSIFRSIKNNWQGLFPDSAARESGSRINVPRHRQDEYPEEEHVIPDLMAKFNQQHA